MSDCLYIGIDPGAHGGMACLCGSIVVDAVPMPATDQDVLWWLRQFTSCSAKMEVFAVLEKVQGFIGHAGPDSKPRGVTGSSMFKLGRSYGAVRMALAACAIPFEEATPQAWQRGLSLPLRSKGESKTQWKNRLKQRAQQLFPNARVTLDVSDALLIAEFCRRRREGKL